MPANATTANATLLDRVCCAFPEVAAFRPLQREAIEAALAGRDSLVVMPTAGGKSLCYQFPALVRDGVTVVISPLIALMKDQVDSFNDRFATDGFRGESGPAVAIHSNMTHEQQETAAARVRVGSVRLLYLSPERMLQPAMIATLRRTRVASFVIDEAHLVESWGEGFRPDYRRLFEIRKLFPAVPIHAFTATATEATQLAICQSLGLRSPAVLVGDFDRPNIHYDVVERCSMAVSTVKDIARLQRAHEKRDAQTLAHVLDLLDSVVHPRRGIVYVFRRADADRLSDVIRCSGVRCDAYHAGLSAQRRTQVQDAFTADGLDVVVATIAFGLGVDIPDIRWVLHAHLPPSISHYHQETGRAGRDGGNAIARLLWDADDFINWSDLFESERAQSRASAHNLARRFEELNAIQLFAEGWYAADSPHCRRAMILRHFGQTHMGECGNCDLCGKAGA